MEPAISRQITESPFPKLLQRYLGENAGSCYQCGRCSAGCPVAFRMDYLPNQIVRMVHLGMEERVLSCRTIWLCASCYTCSLRCPRGIDIAEIMDYLRRRAYKKKIRAPEGTNAPLFNKIFLRDIELFGRLYELGLVGVFNLLSKRPFRDFFIGMQMLSKQKLSLFPKRSGNIKAVREIVRRSGRLARVRRDRLFKL